ncbi:MAG: hypothetical protein K2N13_04970 [Paraprevotella sp.]|nr:hypothetical protein [Paraprevotella sp.]
MSSYLHYIYTEKYGKVTELKEKFGEDAVRQMEAMGYIANAPTKDGDTWRISTRALNLAKQRYRKSTIWERICDWFNLKIRRIDFSI